MDNQPTPNNQLTTPQPPTPAPSAPPVVPVAPATPAVPPTPVPPTPSVSAPQPAPATSPTPPAPIAPNPSPVQPAPLTAPSPIAAPATQPTTPPKKKFGLGKAILIACILALLIGGGVGATFIVMATQPSSIVASAINNMVTAEHISIDGDVNIVYNPSSSSDSVTINLKMLSAGTDHSSNIQVSTDPSVLGVNSPVVSLEVDEVIIDNGNMYFKIKGIYGVLYAADTILGSIFTTGSYTPSDATLSTIQQISDYAEDRWFMVSVEEVMNSSMLSMDAQSKQKYLDGYNCAKDKLSNISSYSSEFSDLYKSHPFINLEQQADSFYNVSLDSTHLAAYSNEIPNTKFSKDLISCANENINITNNIITPEEIDRTMEKFPSVSAKFDGFLDYRLTELKISSADDYYSISSDLKFDYNTPVNISAPSDATSILDAVTYISNIISSSYNIPQTQSATSTIENTKIIEGTS